MSWLKRIALLGGLLALQTTQAASDDPLDPAGIASLWNDVGRLRMSETPRWSDQTVLDDGLCRASFDNGIFVPIASGSYENDTERLVGFVFVGEGKLEARVSSRSDAMRYANHMVLNAGVPREDVAPMVERLVPLRADFTRAVIFSADPVVHNMLRSLDPVGAGTVVDDTVLIQEASERGIHEEFVVTSRRGRLKAQFSAGNLMPSRRLELLRSGFDPLTMIQYDRLVHEFSGVPAGQLRMVAEYLTDTDFRVAAGPKGMGPGGKHDRWLSCFRDRVDHLDTGLRSMVFAHGTDFEGDRNFTRFFGQPILRSNPVRLEPVHAKVEVIAHAKRSLSVLKPRVQSVLTFEAIGDGVRHVSMRLPRHEAVKGSWKLEKLNALITNAAGETREQAVSWLELDREVADSGIDGQMPWQPDNLDSSSNASTGGDLDGETTSFDMVGGLQSTEANQAIAELIGQARDKHQQLLVFFPEPLANGERVQLQVDWKATWNFSNWVSYGNTGSTTLKAALGATTGPRSVLPELTPSRGGTAWDADISVSVPPRRLDVAASGNTTREWTDESGWDWTESTGKHMRRVAIAIGRWHSLTAQGTSTLPGVRTHIFKRADLSQASFDQEIRRQYSFMSLYMKVPKLDELDVYQRPTEPVSIARSRARYYGHAGMAGISSIGTVDVGDGTTQLKKLYPFYTELALARQMAAHVFGHTLIPASSRDAWLTEALSETYAAHYINTNKGEDGLESFFTRINTMRKDVEDPAVRVKTSPHRTFRSLTGGAGSSVQNPRTFQDYGFYVVGWMLRERIGLRGFFDGVRRMSEEYQEKLVTTETFQKALEDYTGRDLGDFFDWWVRGGYLPRVVAEYTLEETTAEDGSTHTRVEGCVLSDVPFGTFDVPVWVRDQAGERAVAALVTVRDGIGWFEITERTGEIEVEVDPDGLIMAYKRKARRVPETTCDSQLKTTPKPEVYEPSEGSQYRTIDGELDGWLKLGPGFEPTRPATDEGTEPATDEGTEPAADEGTEPAADEATEPAADEAAPSGEETPAPAGDETPPEKTPDEGNEG